MPRRNGSVYRPTFTRAGLRFLPELPLAGLLAAALLLARLPGAAAQERTERFIGPGVKLLRWTETNNPAGPMAFSAVEVDATQPYIQLGVSVGKGNSLALEPLSRQAERLTRPDRYPIAGVNGDFFLYPDSKQGGIPTNTVVIDDEVIHTPFPRSCLVVPRNAAPRIQVLKAQLRVTLPSGAQHALSAVNHPREPNTTVLFTPWYGASTRTPADSTEVYLEPEQAALVHGKPLKARVKAVQNGAGNAPLAAGNWVLSSNGAAAAPLRALMPGDVVEVKADFQPALAPGDQVIGGGPRLVRDGKVSVERETGRIGAGFVDARHPRTAVGFNGRKLFLVTVDGRLPGFSAGMTLPELAQAMINLGCTDAVNLDGGGSTTFWARGTVINRPSDGRERPVANGLLVFSTAPKGEAVRLVAQPETVLALPGAEIPLSARGEDQYYNPVAVPSESIQWSVAPALGSVNPNPARFTARPEITPDTGQEYASGTLVGVSGKARTEVPIRVYARPARVEITPAVLKLGTQLRQNFRVRALDAQGRVLLMPPAVQWSASPEVGQITQTGQLATGMASAKGTVSVTVNGVTGSAPVEVAEGFSAALDDFEKAADPAQAWRLRQAGGAEGTVGVTEGPARSGRKALRLEYDFSRGSGTRAIYADATRNLGQPLALKLWVYGDGQNAWLRVRVKDAKGQAYLLDAARTVNWNEEWRELRIPISEDYPGPVTLESIYVVETDGALKPKGVLRIDDIGVEQ